MVRRKMRHVYRNVQVDVRQMSPVVERTVATMSRIIARGQCVLPIDDSCITKHGTGFKGLMTVLAGIDDGSWVNSDSGGVEPSRGRWWCGGGGSGGGGVWWWWWYY